MHDKKGILRKGGSGGRESGRMTRGRDRKCDETDAVLDRELRVVCISRTDRDDDLESGSRSSFPHGQRSDGDPFSCLREGERQERKRHLPHSYISLSLSLLVSSLEREEAEFPVIRCSRVTSARGEACDRGFAVAGETRTPFTPRKGRDR